MASIQDISSQYFRSMNGLANKISNDLASTREAYQDLWYQLSDDEQRQVLDEAVIDPAAVLKYTRLPGSDVDWNEDASDFSWFTKSQLNLFTSIQLKGDKHRTPVKKVEPFSPLLIHSDSATENKIKHQYDCNLLNKLKSKVPVLKSSSNEEKQSLVENRSQMNLTPKMTISKPKTPPPPPPTKSSNTLTEKRALLSNDNESDHSEDIPKTGFDFLDNW